MLKAKILELERILHSHALIVFWIVLAVCTVLIVSRRSQAIFHPQFWAEDGKIWYAQAYNQGPFSTLFHTYASTFSVGTRLAGSVALLLPLRYAPLLFNLISLGCQLLTVVLLLSKRFKRIIPYKSLAIIISLIFVAIPNASEVFLNLANIQWHLGIAAFLVLIAERPKTKVWVAFDVVVLLLTGLTGPLGLVLLPIALIIWYKTKNNTTRRNALLIVTTSILQIISLGILNNANRINGQPNANWLKLTKMLVGQVFTGGLLGEHYVNYFYNNTLALVIILIVALLIIVYAVIRGPLWLKLANLFSVLVITLTLISITPLPNFDVWEGLTNPGGGQRYWYIPIFVWLMTLFWLLVRGKSKILKTVAGICFILFVWFGVGQGWKLPIYINYHFSSYVKQFNAAPKGQTVTIPTNPAGWQMVLIKK